MHGLVIQFIYLKSLIRSRHHSLSHYMHQFFRSRSCPDILLRVGVETGLFRWSRSQNKNRLKFSGPRPVYFTKNWRRKRSPWSIQHFTRNRSRGRKRYTFPEQEASISSQAPDLFLKHIATTYLLGCWFTTKEITRKLSR